MIKLYADGSCPRNPGPGGWAFVILEFRHGQTDMKKARMIERSGAVKDATNNTMELQAVIEGLQMLIELGKMDERIACHSDSSYVIKGINEWRRKWKYNKWRRKDRYGKLVPIANVEQWQLLDRLLDSFPDATFSWVRGHDGNTYNERCDVLAGEAVWQLIESQ